MLIGIAMGTSAANAQDTKMLTASTQPVNGQVKMPHNGKLMFQQDSYDFGEVAEGPKAEHDFVLTNTGKEPVVITNASAGCSCTVSEWPRQPILPGKKEKIHVVFNTAGRVGPFTKDITILSDAEQPQMFLHIKGTVKPKPAGIAASVPPAGSSAAIK